MFALTSFGSDAIIWVATFLSTAQLTRPFLFFFIRSCAFCESECHEKSLWRTEVWQVLTPASPSIWMLMGTLFVFPDVSSLEAVRGSKNGLFRDSIFESAYRQSQTRLVFRSTKIPKTKVIARAVTAIIFAIFIVWTAWWVVICCRQSILCCSMLRFECEANHKHSPQNCTLTEVLKYCECHRSYRWQQQHCFSDPLRFEGQSCCGHCVPKQTQVREEGEDEWSNRLQNQSCMSPGVPSTQTCTCVQSLTSCFNQVLESLQSLVWKKKRKKKKLAGVRKVLDCKELVERSWNYYNGNEKKQKWPNFTVRRMFFQSVLFDVE